MSSANIDDAEPQCRAAIAIRRTHQRFLLRQQQFTRQYAAMYRCRLQTLQDRVLRSLRRGATGPGASPPSVRVLELHPGQRALCIGVAYKQMRLLPRFLDEYQKELVRIDAGEDEDDDCAANIPVTPKAENPMDTNDCSGSLCTTGDEVFLEDGSGRLLLEGVPAHLLCTGLVVGVDGTLRENGRLLVHSYALTDPRDAYVPRAIARGPREPCYIGFACGFSLGCAEASDADTERGRAMVELLVDYLAGNLGDDAMAAQAARVARVVIGGNSIPPTDELRLKRKVKLDPSDHTRLGDDRLAGGGAVTSARLMQEVDAVMARLADTVEVELMPGDNDMTNAFQPQQPLHPLLLPDAARRSSLKLVTNPFEFSVFPGVEGVEPPVEGKGDGSGTTFFVSSGQGLNDFCRETRYESRLDAMAALLRSGCACPTAPNTLFSYPFKESDPFVFTHIPHCFVCCDQPEMLTRWESFGIVDENGDEENKVTKQDGTDGVRMICIPPFAQTGTLVLVDVNSPRLETTVVNFALPSS